MAFSPGDVSVAMPSVTSTDTAEEQPVVAIRKPTQIRPSKTTGKPAVRVKENYWDMVADYERHLRALNRASNTLSAYQRGLIEFAEWLKREGVSLHIEAIQRPHIQSFMRWALEERGVNAKTVYLWFSTLRAFFNWMVAEGEIDASPMARMKAPKVEPKPHTIISDERIDRLLRTCAGRGFYNRRDSAMIRVLFDAGIRRSGLASMRVDHLDLDGGLAQVTSKRHTWMISLGPSTIDALAAYLRARKQHPHAARPDLWLTKQGAMSVRSINGIIDRRCVQAQIPRINPHSFRHTFAHSWLADGGQEGDLMELGGWANTDMIHKVYGRDLAHDRAIKAHKNRRLGDRV